MRNSLYPLGHDPNEIARLETQSRLLEDPLLAELAGKSSRILELGCGVGSNWPLVRSANPNASYLGIDASELAIHEANKRPSASGANFRVMDATKVLFPSESFDFVFSKLVLWSIGTGWSDAISESYRVLSPGGLFYAFEPLNRLILFEPPRPHVEKLIRQWDEEALRRGCDPSIGPKVPSALLNAGFKDVRAKAFPVVALAQDTTQFLAVCENFQQFMMGESAENPSEALALDLKRKAREEFAFRPNGGVVMDFLFVSWGRK